MDKREIPEYNVDMDNLNQNRIFRSIYLADAVEVPVSEWETEPLENVEEISLTAAPVSLPGKPFLDKPVLNVRCPLAAGESKKSLRALFPAPADIAGKEAFSFGFDCRGDVTRLSVALLGENQERFESTVTVFSERWTRILLSLEKIPFSRVKGVELICWGEGEIPRFASELQFSDLRFGMLLDFGFRLGRHNFFEPLKNTEYAEKSLRFRFRAGEELLFPELSEPRYTELNARLAVRETVRLSLINESTCETFRLWLATDKHPDFDETRTRVLEIPRGGLKTVLADFSGEYDEEERLLRLKLSPLSGSGSLRIFEIGFDTERGGLNPEECDFVRSLGASRKNPDALPLPERIFRVSDFGAKGDGYTCDNAAIQAALTAAGRAGGGRVLLESERRYRASHLRIYANTEFFIPKDTVLLQSPYPEDYPYAPAFGHDSADADCNWAHNFLVHNEPLLYAADCENVRIAGGGEIRMCDAGSDKTAVGFPYWPEHCAGVIHLAPIGFFRVRGAEISGIRIRRASTYHIFLVRCERVFLSRVEMTDVRCLSADGIGLCGSKDVTAFGCVLRTNDDGVTLFSVYRDPRARNWWRATPGEDNGVRRVEIDRCRLNSACGGGGKAISFIPWGSDAPDQSLQEISDIYVHDCYLEGGHAVGAWPDNPYHGKQPFDNTETDDYSPVKRIRFLRNIYVGPATLECIRAAEVVSDCGISEK